MASSNEPAGMVDYLNSDGAGPSAEEIEFAMAFLKPGEMDPALLARAADPVRLAAQKIKVGERHARDWGQLCQYRDANAALAGQPVKAVFIGDSITELWAAADPDFFSGGVVGRGISGQTSPQILTRFMADVVALKPQVVHILCGINDIAGNTGPSTPQDYKNNMLAMIALAQAHRVTVVIGSIMPAHNFSWVGERGLDPRPRVAELNTWLRDMADQRCLIWADYHALLKAEDDSMRPEYTRDGVHPVLGGYAVINHLARFALAAALQRASCLSPANVGTTAATPA